MKKVLSQETLDRVERALTMRYNMDHERITTYDTLVPLFVTLGRLANELNGNRQYTYGASVNLSHGRFDCRLECTGLRERRLERLSITGEGIKFVRSDDGLGRVGTITATHLQDILVPLLVELDNELPDLAHYFAECVEQ